LKIEKTLTVVKILKYLEANPNSKIPEIKTYLGIESKSNPTQREKDLYYCISVLDRGKFIKKKPIKNISSGGAWFTLGILKNGKKLLKELEKCFIS